MTVQSEDGGGTRAGSAAAPEASADTANNTVREVANRRIKASYPASAGGRSAVGWLSSYQRPVSQRLRWIKVQSGWFRPAGPRAACACAPCPCRGGEGKGRKRKQPS